MRKFLFFVFLIFLKSAPFFAQSKQSERLFKAGNYSEAIPFLLADLEQKNNLNVKTKLAYCYRMTNQTAKSLQIYGELVKKERVRPEAFLYYGEALMTSEAYDSARIYFQKYTQAVPEDTRAKLLIASLEELKNINAIFADARILPYQHNSDADDSAPVMHKNGFVFSSDRNTGFKPLKEKSGATGRDYLNLYFTDYQKDTTFKQPEWFSGKINEMNRNTGSVSFTSNDKTAYFAQNSSISNKAGTYNMQIFKAEADGNNWHNIEILPFNSPETNLMHPAISPDGSELYFSSNRSGGEGGSDIYYVRKNTHGVWSALENLGNIVNTSASEGFPYMDRAGRLYFCSKGHPGYGGFDIFRTERDNTGHWTKPQNLGKPINSPSDDISFSLFLDGVSGLFTSNREGGDDDIYFFYPKDSLNFLKNEIAYRMPISSVFMEQKDSLKKEENKTINEKTEQNGNEKAIAEPTIIPLEKWNNLDSLFILLAKNKADTSFKISKKNIFLLEKIQFSSKFAIDSLGKLELDKVKMLLESYPIKLQILVHTSRDGKENENLERSKKQGLRMVKYLTEKGILRERLRSKGMGESQPRCEKDCLERFGLDKNTANERIELRVEY
jgi:outer membrane protein OmpA-like peptidoglycan-associated protein/tetratricopeptide (TPR) repeat protein